MTYQELAKQMAQFYKYHPDSWTQGAAARDKDGRIVSIVSIHAAQWCMVGLANKLAPGEFSVRNALYKVVGEVATAGSFNDTPGRTIEQIIEKLESVS